MIRLLAQIISRQIGTPKEGIREGPAPPAVPRPTTVQTTRAGSRAIASLPGTETPAADRWSEQSTQALVVLFTELVQRQVQVARAQEETHEYSSHHHRAPRTDGLRLRAPIHPMAGP